MDNYESSIPRNDTLFSFFEPELNEDVFYRADLLEELFNFAPAQNRLRRRRPMLPYESFVHIAQHIPNGMLLSTVRRVQKRMVHITDVQLNSSTFDVVIDAEWPGDNVVFKASIFREKPSLFQEFEDVTWAGLVEKLIQFPYGIGTITLAGYHLSDAEIPNDVNYLRNEQQLFRRIRKLTVDFCSMDREDLLQMIVRIPELTDLEVRGGVCPSFEKLASLKEMNLQSLRLEDCTVAASDWLAVCRMTSLITLSTKDVLFNGIFRGVPRSSYVSEEGEQTNVFVSIPQLSELRNLREFNIIAPFMAGDPNIIAQLPLKTLSIQLEDRTISRGIVISRLSPTIEKLELKGNVRLWSFANAKSLRQLVINGECLAECDMETVSNTRLRYFDITFQPGDVVLKYFTALQRIHSVRFTCMSAEQSRVWLVPNVLWREVQFSQCPMDLRAELLPMLRQLDLWAVAAKTSNLEDLTLRWKPRLQIGLQRRPW